MLLIVFAIIAVGGFVVVQLVHDRFLEEVDTDNRQVTSEVVAALDVFGPDVSIVPRENTPALAATIIHSLENKQRTRVSTRETIEREFRPVAVAARYRSLYEDVIGGRP